MYLILKRRGFKSQGSNSAAIVNLRKKLGKEPKKNDENTRIIVIEYDNSTIVM